MAKHLIIAEKPSLMRTIMHALSTKGEHFSGKDEGEYYESEHYIATAQFGHLLELKKPGEYDESLEKWRLDTLPFFPKKYKYNIRSDAKRRFDTIRRLTGSPAVSKIYHCGDPDREGQILVDLVLKEIGNEKPVMRPELKALTDEAILDAFKRARPNEEYRNVYNEGMSRMCFDWDYGINLSRYATIKAGARPALNIGRVVGAIVNEIYNRDKAIEDFVPEEYYKIVSDVEGGFKLTSKEMFEADRSKEAEAWAETLQGGDSVVANIEEKRIKKKPPKLFSQTTLQSAMSKRFNYKPDKTLELAQSLYEKGLISYPRTNTEYIAEAEKELVEDVIEKINRDGHLAFRGDKSIFDDTKIDGHSAITPTGKRPSGLSDDEMNCYKAILYRFMAVFCKEPCLYDKTIVYIDNPCEKFKASGEVLVQEGWQKFEPKRKGAANGEEKDDERTLPKVSVGDIIETDFQAVLAETQPPKHYTVDTLGKWMENPFKKEDSTDEEDYKNILAGLEIGTVATRASILEKATDKGYISLKKKAYHIEPRGRFLVEASRALGIDFSAKMTADMGRNLKAVGRGELGVRDVLSANRAEIERIISADKNCKTDSAKSGGREAFVLKEKTDAQVYAPTGEEISFNREWGGHTFTNEEVALLLAGKEISFEAISSKGNNYTATGSLQKQKYKGKTFWGFKLKEREFPSEFLGHKFTEAEKDILMNGKRGQNKISVDDLWSEKKQKYFSATLTYKNGRIDMKFEKSKG